MLLAKVVLLCSIDIIIYILSSLKKKMSAFKLLFDRMNLNMCSSILDWLLFHLWTCLTYLLFSSIYSFSANTTSHCSLYSLIFIYKNHDNHEWYLFQLAGVFNGHYFNSLYLHFGCYIIIFLPLCCLFVVVFCFQIFLVPLPSPLCRSSLDSVSSFSSSS